MSNELLAATITIIIAVIVILIYAIMSKNPSIVNNVFLISGLVLIISIIIAIEFHSTFFAIIIIGSSFVFFPLLSLKINRFTEQVYGK